MISNDALSSDTVAAACGLIVSAVRDDPQGSVPLGRLPGLVIGFSCQPKTY